jgi:hypothetical protein
MVICRVSSKWTVSLGRNVFPTHVSMLIRLVDYV